VLNVTCLQWQLTPVFKYDMFTVVIDLSV
jgi:hypothetical protein